MSFAATWMDPVIVILSEKDKDRYHVIRFICASLKKKKKKKPEQKKLFTKQKQNRRCRKQSQHYQGERGKNWQIGIDIHTLLHIKLVTNMDLREAEDIKKRQQEYTEELYKKDLHDPDNHNGVITHLEPDILE